MDAKAIVSDRRDKIQSGLRIVTQEIVDKVKSINIILKKSGVPTITLPSFPRFRFHKCFGQKINSCFNRF